MSDEKKTVNRRKALKVLGASFGAAGTLSIYQNQAFGQHQHMQHGAKAHADASKSAKPRYFTPAEMAVLVAMSDHIIPSDEHSPGAKEAGVAAFIDVMVSASPEETRTMWREGIASIDKASEKKYQKKYAQASVENQLDLLKDISKNEFDPKSTEEKFFRAMKGMTIDGFYTSEIGIHKDLQYKGNSYTKDFVGCTHPEHKA
jgi:hypothetical protein